MMQSKLVAQSREKSGTSQARRMRRAGRLPGVVCNEKGESRKIDVNKHEFDMMLRSHSSEIVIVDLDIDGKLAGKVLLKEVQHHPVSGDALHIDLVEVSMTKRMRIAIPIRLVGHPMGVEKGGILEQLLREVDVECLPTDLVETINVDVSGIDLNKRMSAGEIVMPAGVVLLTPKTVGIAAVTEPKLEEEPAAAEGAAAPAEGEAAKEPELIKKPEKEKEKAEGGKAE